jgi:DNA excision repair protein ERCC-3
VAGNFFLKKNLFDQNRARSGIIVLPCGAGKTLVGIAATSRVKKRTLCLCINNVTVKQWEKQFLQFSNVNPDCIFKFISETKNQKIPDLTQPCVVISTYTMISRSDEGRSTYSKELIDKLGEVEWGLLVLDEV